MKRPAALRVARPKHDDRHGARRKQPNPSGERRWLIGQELQPEATEQRANFSFRAERRGVGALHRDVGEALSARARERQHLVREIAGEDRAFGKRACERPELASRARAGHDDAARGQLSRAREQGADRRAQIGCEARSEVVIVAEGCLVPRLLDRTHASRFVHASALSVLAREGRRFGYQCTASSVRCEPGLEAFAMHGLVQLSPHLQ